MSAHPFVNGLKPTIHIAHRGGARVAPENTLFAFKKAVSEFKTDMLELDVHLTKDGVLVVSHDATVDRCTDGKGAIAALTVKEVQKLDASAGFAELKGKDIRIPTLREVLRAFRELRLNIDLKDHRAGTEAVLAELIRAERAEERVCVGADDDAVAERILAALPEACHFYPRGALAAWVMAVKNGHDAPKDPRFTVLAMPVEFEGTRLPDPALVSVAAAEGKWLEVWTVDDPEEMRRLIGEGVGGIMTDRPDLLRELLNQFGRKK